MYKMLKYYSDSGIEIVCSPFIFVQSFSFVILKEQCTEIAECEKGKWVMSIRWNNHSGISPQSQFQLRTSA